MSETIDPKFIIETAAANIAMRAALTALFRAHPQPEALRRALRETQQLPGAHDGELPPPIQTRVDQILGELVSHLPPKI